MVRVVGSNGFLGTQIVDYLSARGLAVAKYDLSGNGCRKLDITSFDSCDLDFVEGDVVVLLAAVSSPDVCKNNYSLAYSINVIGTSRFIDECLKRKCKIIFASSDAIYGDTGLNAVDEYSQPKPFGPYAQMKFEIENRYKGFELFKAVRFSYVFSGHDKFSLYLKECCSRGNEAEVFEGLFRNVVSVDVVLESIYRLCINFAFNEYYAVNISGNQCLSRHDLAKVFKNNIDHSLSFKCVPVPSSVLESRPNSIRTKSLFLEKLLGHKIKNLM